MSPRLSSALLVQMLIRRAFECGGHAAVLARGDPYSGTILLACAERGSPHALCEYSMDATGRYVLLSVGPAPPLSSDIVSDYLSRRRKSDPDLWAVELDIAEAERFAAETLTIN